jgi:hypothetical protein
MTKAGCGKPHHNTERKTQARRQEGITILNLEVFLPWKLTNDEIHTYYRCYPPSVFTLHYCSWTPAEAVSRRKSLPPNVHAIYALVQSFIDEVHAGSPLTDSTDRSHDPPSRVIVEYHVCFPLNDVGMPSSPHTQVHDNRGNAKSIRRPATRREEEIRY